MNKVEKYLMKQIERKDEEIKAMNQIINHMQHFESEYFKEQRFINIVSEKAEIKSFESSDGTFKRYIDLGDINDYGMDQEHFAFVADLLGLNKSECCDCECTECSDCECDDCSEGSNDDAE